MEGYSEMKKRKKGGRKREGRERKRKEKKKGGRETEGRSGERKSCEAAIGDIDKVGPNVTYISPSVPVDAFVISEPEQHAACSATADAANACSMARRWNGSGMR
ncbi:hypothetical protein M514_04477 [Trichuris suis]|uniref:Uncharacterized protein n=1 Tax=Trichuris suis TaxID=68888 RepID=A0A085MC31_9BILA|nr:hypothetical protein M513_04477 [Trichuris suis]KFD61222.1 hypothetical protein M514_04477 [Trichuris suis]